MDWDTVRSARNWLWVQLDGVEYQIRIPEHMAPAQEPELTDVPG